jgi:CubicO group peptidase (beta-lactamase class C family)
MRSPFLALAIVACVSCGAGASAPALRAASAPLAKAEVPPAPTPSLPPEPALDRTAKLDALFAAQAKPGVPGCAVGVYRAGEVLAARAYGLASLEHDLPLATDSVFDIASISKQFTAMVILLLEREGKLSIDDDVRKYVPELPNYGPPIRVRHLLHHTSGLREYIDLLTLAGRTDDRVTDEDLLLLLQRQKALNFRPGTQWRYSNTGYFLLAVVASRASGMKFSALVKERILEPLGMKSTALLEDHTAIVRGRATGYFLDKDGAFRTAISRWEHLGASRVATSVEDLARWDANFYEPRVGDRALLEKLRTPGKLDDGRPLDYALGLFEGVLHGRRAEWHTGSTGGYVSDLVRYPAERLTVSVLCNATDDPKTQPWALAPQVADLFLPQRGVAEAASESAGARRSPSPEELRELVGAYYDPETFALRTIAVEEGRITFGTQLEPGGFTAPFILEGPRKLTSTKTPVRFTFEPAQGATPARIIRSVENEPPTAFLRFEPIKPPPSALAEYVGRYVSDEIPREIQVAVADDHLRLGTWGHAPDPEPLAPLMRDAFRNEIGGLQFERDARGRVRAFVVTSSGLRGVRFTRR